MSLREARESTAQKEIAVDRDQKVVQRTEELAALVDSIPGLLGVLTAEGEVEFVNRRLLEYTGRTLEDFRLASDSPVNLDDQANSVAAWRRAVETGQSFSVDHRLRRADGAYRWFQAAGLPMRDADGQIIRWPILLTDIHERKTAEERLAHTEELVAIVDSIPGLIGVLSADGLVVEFVNRQLLDTAVGRSKILM